MARTELFSRKQAGGVFTIAGVDKHPGSIFFVHSGTGTDAAGKGRNPDAPVATIDYGVGLCTAGKGDVVYVMPGHNEGLGNAQITVDIEGVSIIGLGRGSIRPRIDFDHANSSIDIAAHGVTIKNLGLLPSVTDVLVAIDVNANKTDTLIEDVEALPGEDGGGVDDFAVVIDIKAGCSRTVVRRPRIRQHASGAGYIAGIKLTGASDDVVIEDPDIVTLGAAAVAPINGDTTLSTNVRVKRATLVSDAEPGIELLTGTTGILEDVRVFSNLGTIAAAIVADGCARFNCLYVEVAPEREVAIGTASADD